VQLPAATPHIVKDQPPTLVLYLIDRSLSIL